MWIMYQNGHRERQRKRRLGKCQEETEQARGARDQAQVEAWAKAVVAGAKAAVARAKAAVARAKEAVDKAKEAVDKAGEVVLRQARAVIAFAPNVVKRQPMHWGAPVMSRNVPNAERP
jgi:ElaB/YqjD/DUF883 family membrane-anchored ribosome-binding protein